MHNLPNLADRQDPKGNGLRLCSTKVYSNHSNEARRKAPSYGHEIMDTRNGVTRLRLSSNGAGNQPQAQTGRMTQEANAFGKADGYADVGRVYGKSSAMEG